MNEKYRYNHSSSYNESNERPNSGKKIYKSSKSMRLTQNDSKPKDNSYIKIRNSEYSIPSNVSDKVSYILAKYSSIKFEDYEIQELYTNFKEIEKVFESMIDVRRISNSKFNYKLYQKDARQALNAVSDFNSVRDYLVDIARLILKKDIKFAKSKDLDRRLWALIKRQLESIVKTKTKSDSLEDEINKLISSNMEILKKFMDDIPNVYN